VSQKGNSLTDELSRFELPQAREKSELRWELEMNDCEVRFISGDVSSKPHAAVKISNRKQRRQVVDAHIAMEEKVRMLEEQIQAQIKAVEKAAVWEEKFTQSKIQLSQVQMQYFDLEREHDNLKAKFGVK